MLTLFVGIAMLAPRVVKPLATLVGSRAARRRRRLARENAVRNPGRTASTAAALMIGLALVTVVATLGAGLRTLDRGRRSSSRSTPTTSLTAKDGGGSFPAASDEAVAAPPASRSPRASARTPRKVAGDEVAVTGIDPKTIDHFYDYKWSQGSLARARRRRRDRQPRASPSSTPQGRQPAQRAVLQRREARRCTWSASTRRRRWTPLLGDVSIAQKAFDGAFARPQNLFTFVDGSSKAALAKTTGRLSRTPSSRPRPSSPRAAPTGWR